MNLKEIHTKLEGQCPTGYRINEIISISYPYRRIVINAMVNKSPEESIKQLYTIFIEAIKSGLNTENDLSYFLGVSKDDFILRELYFLRERGYLDLVAGKWMVTESGYSFVKDNSILKILSEEDFQFYLDAHTDEILANIPVSNANDFATNKLESIINLPIKSPELIKDKSEQIVDLYNKLKAGQSFLIDYNADEIKFDKIEFVTYYLIEYIPTKDKESDFEPRIEIRNVDKDYSLNKRLTEKLSVQYPNIVYQFTDSERAIVAKIEKQKELKESFVQLPILKNKAQIETLSIWETKAKFLEAIKEAKERLFIESPWIKRAALNYISEIEVSLKRGVRILVLYGIEGSDEHDKKAEEQMKRLQNSYSNFKLIHLPTHFENVGNSEMVGSHKKLVIKDNDYYIHGSFNFLSFNKSEGQKVANEETLLIGFDVEQKWNNVFKVYNLNESIFEEI